MSTGNQSIATLESVIKLGLEAWASQIGITGVPSSWDPRATASLQEQQNSAEAVNAITYSVKTAAFTIASEAAHKLHDTGVAWATHVPQGLHLVPKWRWQQESVDPGHLRPCRVSIRGSAADTTELGYFDLEHVPHVGMTLGELKAHSSPSEVPLPQAEIEKTAHKSNLTSMCRTRLGEAFDRETAPTNSPQDVEKAKQASLEAVESVGSLIYGYGEIMAARMGSGMGELQVQWNDRCDLVLVPPRTDRGESVRVCALRLPLAMTMNGSVSSEGKLGLIMKQHINPSTGELGSEWPATDLYLRME